MGIHSLSFCQRRWEAWLDPVNQLEKLLVNNLYGLDQLYLSILKEIFGDDEELTDDDDFQHRFCCDNC